MKLNRQNFLERLEMVYPAIAANPVVAHYSYFKISKGKTDVIDRLQAFNGVVLIETQLDEGIENACAIPAEPFLKLLRSLTDKEIELIFKKDEVKVKAKTIKGTLCKVFLLIMHSRLQTALSVLTIILSVLRQRQGSILL